MNKTNFQSEYDMVALTREIQIKRDRYYNLKRQYENLASGPNKTRPSVLALKMSVDTLHKELSILNSL